MTPKEVDAVLALWNKEFKVQMKDFEFKTSRKLIFAAFRHLVFIIRKEELGQNPKWHQILKDLERLKLKTVDLASLPGAVRDQLIRSASNALVSAACRSSIVNSMLMAQKTDVLSDKHFGHAHILEAIESLSSHTKGDPGLVIPEWDKTPAVNALRELVAILPTPRNSLVDEDDSDRTMFPAPEIEQLEEDSLMHTTLEDSPPPAPKKPKKRKAPVTPAKKPAAAPKASPKKAKKAAAPAPESDEPAPPPAPAPESGEPAPESDEPAPKPVVVLDPRFKPLLAKLAAANVKNQTLEAEKKTLTADKNALAAEVSQLQGQVSQLEANKSESERVIAQLQEDLEVSMGVNAELE